MNEKDYNSILSLLLLLTPIALAGTDPRTVRGDFESALGSSNSIARHWVRAVFHDSGTFDRSDGSGGSDGSLQFELDRPENTGLDATIGFYRGISQRRGVSMADAIIFGANLAVEACGGPRIPFKPGRRDARNANPTGT